MLKTAKYFSILLAALLFFTTCKKYPKNNLWMRNPTKIIARGGIKTTQGTNTWRLVCYIVNGVDLTDQSYLDVYKEVGVLMYIDGNVRDGTYKFKCSDVMFGGWDIESPKKVMHFNFAETNFKANSVITPRYKNQINIFMATHAHTKILKLTTDEFWIELNYNTNKYEMHFE